MVNATNHDLDDLDRVAAACRALRAMRDMTQPDFAALLNLSAQSLRSIEKGELVDPRRFVLPICNAAGVTLEEFETICTMAAASTARVAQAGAGRSA